MNARRGAVGLALLCTLLFCAFAAPNAVAVKGTTAFECKEVATGAEFEDEHCSKKVGGGGKGWKHEKLAAGQTLLTANNNITGAKVIRPGLSGTIEKKEFVIEASAFKTCANKAFLENKKNGAEQSEAAGETCGEFTGVEVTKPAGCTIKGGTIKLNEKTKGKTVVKEVEKKQQMFIEFIPPEAKPFVSFTFEGATCELKGTTAEVTGTAKANVSTSESLLEGPTLTFTAVNSTLKVGGNEAFFDATFTVRMQPGTEEPPVVLTTTEK